MNDIHPYLGSLLHLSDPTLPIGGYTHSNGLETYVQQKIVHNTQTAEQFVLNMLSNNILYNDASFVRLAYEAATDGNMELIRQLDRECTALKAPMEIRQASQKLGVRLMKIFQRQREFQLITLFEEALKNKEIDGHYCIVFGIYACLMEIPLKDALFAFYYNAAVGMVTNSVKLIPLGQLDGQDILFRLQPAMQQLTDQTLRVERELVGLCNIGFDIRCMQHERLYSRLYMS